MEKYPEIRIYNKTPYKNNFNQINHDSHHRNVQIQRKGKYQKVR
jgi:hypothetical protein